MAEQIVLEVTREQLEEARRKLAEMGLPLTGDVGAVARNGYEGTYLYADGLLTLTLAKKPWYIPASALRSRLLAAVEPYGIKEKRG